MIKSPRRFGAPVYLIVEVKPPDVPKADEVLRDDLVSRQSIAVRDGPVLGFPNRARLILIEGADAVLARAADLFKGFGTRLEGADAEAVWKAFKAQDEDVASGIGLIFG